MIEAETLQQLVDGDGPIGIRVEAVLTLHQRVASSACLCGFDRLGASFPRHQMEELQKAGLLKS